MTNQEYEILIGQLVQQMTNDASLIESGKTTIGRKNKWIGVSSYEHQIDVTIENQTDVLIVECKHWRTRSVGVESLLTLLARVRDIMDGPKVSGRRVRGALATTMKFQKGVHVLARYYNKEVSLFEVRSVDDFAAILHRYWIQAPSIPSEEKFGMPTIIQHPPR